jgi:histone H3/H4
VLGTLQEAVEHTLLEMIPEMSNRLAAIHAKRVTLMVRDMHFVRQVFGMHDPSIWFASVWHINHRNFVE